MRPFEDIFLNDCLSCSPNRSHWIQQQSPRLLIFLHVLSPSPTRPYPPWAVWQSLTLPTSPFAYLFLGHLADTGARSWKPPVLSSSLSGRRVPRRLPAKPGGEPALSPSLAVLEQAWVCITFELMSSRMFWRLETRLQRGEDIRETRQICRH